jgi:hypothetical protein
VYHELRQLKLKEQHPELRSSNEEGPLTRTPRRSTFYNYTGPVTYRPQALLNKARSKFPLRRVSAYLAERQERGRRAITVPYINPSRVNVEQKHDEYLATDKFYSKLVDHKSSARHAEELRDEDAFKGKIVETDRSILQSHRASDRSLRLYYKPRFSAPSFRLRKGFAAKVRTARTLKRTTRKTRRQGIDAFNRLRHIKGCRLASLRAMKLNLHGARSMNKKHISRHSSAKFTTVRAIAGKKYYTQMGVRRLVTAKSTKTEGKVYFERTKR